MPSMCCDFSKLPEISHWLAVVLMIHLGQRAVKQAAPFILQDRKHYVRFFANKHTVPEQM